MLYAKYQDAVIRCYWENCYEHFLPLTINVEILTESVDRKLMSDRHETHGMGHMSMLYAKYQEVVMKTVTKLFSPHAHRPIFIILSPMFAPVQPGQKWHKCWRFLNFYLYYNQLNQGKERIHIKYQDIIIILI
jgi:hypothetical protein